MLVYVRTRIALLFLFLISIPSVYADKPNVINFYRDKYRAANKNWSIGEDSLGIMYFGNDKGLLEFDGIRWKLYTLPEAEVVRAVSISNDNRIFTGGYEEFGVWERDLSGELIYTSLSKNLKKGTDFHNDDIWKILATDSLVYFQSFGHVYEYDYKKVRVYNTEESNLLFLMHVYDEFWIQKIEGSLYRLAGGALKEIPGSSLFASTEVRVVLPFRNNQYLIGTSTMGFYIYDGRSFFPWVSNCSAVIREDQVNCGILKSNGNYFFGTILNGVYEVNASGEIINHFSTGNFLQNNTVLALFEDNSGNVWTALDRGITYIHYMRDMECYIDPSGQTGALYSAAFFDDKLFLGTNQGLFYLPKNKLSQPESFFDHLRIVNGTQGQIWDIKPVGDKLLCGHNYGLKVIDRNLNVTNNPHISTGVYKINPVEYKGNHLLFISTYFVSSVLSWNLDKLHSFEDIREPVMDIEIDHWGNVWLGHVQKGLYRCRFLDGINQLKSIQSYGGDANDGFPYHFRIFKLGSRVVFFGNDRFYIYNDLEDKIVEFKEMNRCFEKVHSIKNIIPISETLFYALTNNCVYKCFYDGHDIRIINQFDIGYDNLSLVNIYENAVALDDSLGLICLDNGFLIHNFKCSASRIQSSPTIPHIRSVTAIDSKNNKNYLYPGSDMVQIPYSQNALLFDFFAKNVFSDNLFFQYQLEGVNSGWSQPVKVNEVLYERLPKGEYTFLLRTVDNLGDYSETLSFSFRILPPWYANSWAYVGYIVLFLLVMAGIWFMLLRRYRNAHLLKVRMREEQRLRRQNIHLKKEIEEKDAELFSQTSFITKKNELIMKIKHEVEEFYNSYSGNKILKPLYLKIESLLDKNLDMEDDWKMFLIQFERRHTGFFKKMKEIEPNLTSHDLKLCACLKLNLSSKDIASLMNISLRGVENSRYRLRKKLNLSPNQNLNEYFLDI